MSAEHHDTGKAFLPNLAPNVSPAFEPVVQTGRAVKLESTNDLPIPIHYTLGTEARSDSDLINYSATSTYTTSNITNTSISMDITAVSTDEVNDMNLYMYRDDTLISEGDYVEITFDIVVNSGSAVCQTMNIANTVPDDSGNLSAGDSYLTGSYTVRGLWGNGSYFYLRFDIPNGGTLNIDITNYSIKQITNPNSYLSFHDIANDEVIQTDMSTIDPSTTYTFNDTTINNILTHKTALDATSLANIQAEPNLLGELGINGSAVGVNITLDATDSYYACSELSGADVFDARVAGNDATITSYAETIRTNANNQSKGLQTTALVLDSAGIPTTYNDTANTAMVYSDSIINTGFKPNLDVYSIEEKITGELQDFGSELVTNGTFDTDTDWTKQAGWTISGDEAHSNGGVSQLIYQSDVVEIGKVYLCTYQITSYTSGECFIKAGASGTGTTRNSEGTYSEVIVASGTTSASVQSNSFVGSVDNISVKELTTKTQRTETRLLTHDATATPQDKYYINGALQTVTPPLPSSTTAIDLNDTAVIGYADTIERRDSKFRVYSTVLTQAEIDAL